MPVRIQIGFLFGGGRAIEIAAGGLKPGIPLRGCSVIQNRVEETGFEIVEGSDLTTNGHEYIDVHPHPASSIQTGFLFGGCRAIEIAAGGLKPGIPLRGCGTWPNLIIIRLQKSQRVGVKHAWAVFQSKNCNLA